MRTKDYLILAEIAGDDITRYRKPEYVSGYKAPDTLNDLTLGELLRLQAISEPMEAIVTPCNVLFGMTEDEVMEAEASEVMGFSAWTGKEVQRINKLFASTSVPPTSEERQAGIESLDFGPFGMIDYYAQRMGISDHEEVERVPWVRVYKCMDMDAKRQIFQRRLREVLQKKNK